MRQALSNAGRSFESAETGNDHVKFHERKWNLNSTQGTAVTPVPEEKIPFHFYSTFPETRQN